MYLEAQFICIYWSYRCGIRKHNCISWFQVIKANDDLTPEHHQFFLYQMLRGLKYIHTGKAHTLLMANLDLPSSLDASDASVENAA